MLPGPTGSSHRGWFEGASGHPRLTSNSCAEDYSRTHRTARDRRTLLAIERRAARRWLIGTQPCNTYCHRRRNKMSRVMLTPGAAQF